jgi:hypothetical protein
VSDQSDAKAMIAESGQAMTLTYPANGSYDTATATVSAGTPPAPASTSGVILPLSTGLKNMPGSTIGLDDQRLILPGDITQPAIGTTVTVGTKSYVITQVAPLAPSGTPLIHDCIIRGAP